jgi:CBS-domain-containing membrane protein
LLAREIMSPAIAAVAPTARLEEVVERMLTAKVRVAPVTAGTTLVGLITASDLLGRGGLVSPLEDLEKCLRRAPLEPGSAGALRGDLPLESCPRSGRFTSPITGTDSTVV